jgi:hypothetical protein
MTVARLLFEISATGAFKLITACCDLVRFAFTLQVSVFKHVVVAKPLHIFARHALTVNICQEFIG